MTYRIIERVSLPDRPGYQPQEVILAELPGNRATPFVTWRRNDPDRGGDGGRFWGHYCENLGTARGDLNKRVQEYPR